MNRQSAFDFLTEGASPELNRELIDLQRWRAKYPHAEQAILQETHAVIAEGRPVSRIQPAEIFCRVRAIHGIPISNKGFFARLLLEICPELRAHVHLKSSKYDPLFENE